MPSSVLRWPHALRLLVLCTPLVAACDVWDDRDRRAAAEAACGPLPDGYWGDADCIGAEDDWDDDDTCCNSSWPVCDVETGEWGIYYCDEPWPDAALPDGPRPVPDAALPDGPPAVLDAAGG